MQYNFNNEVKLFMLFDILGDTVRTGPQLWQINRERLEDVKNHTLDLLLIARILKNYENRIDIEAKIVHMIDKVHSATTFIKYQSEKDIDMNDPRIIPQLRNHPFVVKKIAEGKDLADIFFEFHLNAVNITDDECQKYCIKREEANNIVDTVKGFAQELYNQKLNGTLLNDEKGFPKDAMIYRRKKTKI